MKTRFTLKVRAGARKTGFAGKHGDAWKLHVAAPPVNIGGTGLGSDDDPLNSHTLRPKLQTRKLHQGFYPRRGDGFRGPPQDYEIVPRGSK